PECDKLKKLLADNFPDRFKKIRFPETTGIGIKPTSRQGTERLVKAAIKYAIDHDKPSVTLVHKGNIMKFTEGAFRDWGYEVAQKQFGATLLDGGPWQVIKKGTKFPPSVASSLGRSVASHDIVVKDVI